MLLQENFSIKQRVINIIENPSFYSKEDMKKAYTDLQNDNRLSIETKQSLLDLLRKEYKR